MGLWETIGACAASLAVGLVGGYYLGKPATDTTTEPKAEEPKAEATPAPEPAAAAA